MSQRNPFIKGKSKLISQLILDGKRNDEVLSFVKDNRLDTKFTNPVTMKAIQNIRYSLKSNGYLNSDGTVKKSPQLGAFEESNEGNRDTPQIVTGSKGEITVKPDWDLLTMENVNRIGDPKLRAEILEYKTAKQMEKEEKMPTEYATKDQFVQLEAEIKGYGERFNEIMETLNALKEEDDDPEDDPAPIAEEKPTVVEEEPKSREVRAGEDELIELQGMVISNKMIGFTPKSLMLYDLTKHSGFEGNLADFVNTCIGDAFKGRQIQLAVIDKKVIA